MHTYFELWNSLIFALILILQPVQLDGMLDLKYLQTYIESTIVNPMPHEIAVPVSFVCSILLSTLFLTKISNIFKA